MLQSINPYSNKLIAEYREHTSSELDRMVNNSEKAFSIWKGKTFEERALCFMKLADLLLSEKEEYARLITAEMGKPLKEALAEVEKCVVGIKYYAEQAVSFLKPTKIETEAKESYVVYEPIGTVLALMPWNFPFWQVIRCAAPAMMAGNTILLKLAPNATGCALALEKAFLKADFPEGCFQSLKIQNETTTFLIQKKAIKAISLTGSERAGVIVAAEAGRNLKKVVLELGGSDPFIVLGDADLEYAAELAVKARLQNSGQSCIAGKRFVLVKSIADQFLFLLKEKLESLKIGDPLDPFIHMGPIARRDLKESLLQQVKKSLTMGATMLYGSLNETEDNFFTPVILSNLLPGMPAYEEELFGPVFSVIEVTSETEAIRVANDSRYGLGASVWTKDAERARRIAMQLECGMVFVNDFVHSDIRLPFGGIKLSGYGRELSEVGMKEFMNMKTVYIKC